MEDQEPNETLYINNLNDKIKIPELKRNLYHLFSQFGTIHDIVASKVYKMRGQAFVVFDNISTSSTALQSLQNFEFFGKVMRITYARGKSDAISRLAGTYSAKVRKPRAERRNEERQAKIEEENQIKTVLIVENVHTRVTEQMLVELFSSFTGFLMLKIQGRDAFVKYETRKHAALAKAELQEHQITSNSRLKIRFNNSLDLIECLKK